MIKSSKKQKPLNESNIQEKLTESSKNIDIGPFDVLPKYFFI